MRPAGLADMRPDSPDREHCDAHAYAPGYCHADASFHARPERDADANADTRYDVRHTNRDLDRVLADRLDAQGVRDARS